MGNILKLMVGKYIYEVIISYFKISSFLSNVAASFGGFKMTRGMRPIP